MFQSSHIIHVETHLGKSEHNISTGMSLGSFLDGCGKTTRPAEVSLVQDK